MQLCLTIISQTQTNFERYSIKKMWKNNIDYKSKQNFDILIETLNLHLIAYFKNKTMKRSIFNIIL